jgi:DNA-binding NarL/FixJ family response regulator
LPLSEETPARLKKRLEAFLAAFLADAKPGLVFESGRLVLANEAARGLLGTAVADEFLERLETSLMRGSLEPDLTLQTQSGIYVPALQPTRSLARHPTVICFLFKQRGLTAAFESLSERELRVLMLLVKGFTNGQIAKELGISVETVRTHISHALGKTGLRTRAGLVGRALGR